MDTDEDDEDNDMFGEVADDGFAEQWKDAFDDENSSFDNEECEEDLDYSSDYASYEDEEDEEY